jgi:hypothetical protein
METLLRPHDINQTDNNFIGGWYIDPKVCDYLLDVYWDPTTFKYKGCSASKTPTPEIKDSMDTHIDANNPILNPYLQQLDICIKHYMKWQPWCGGARGFSLRVPINIQHYKVGGGFKEWHCERSSADDEIRDRHLVFMTYLNDVDDGGTEFFHQKLTIKAEKGLTLIWPVDWTHLHRGQISHTKEKTITTGWLSF